MCSTMYSSVSSSFMWLIVKPSLVVPMKLPSAEAPLSPMIT